MANNPTHYITTHRTLISTLTSFLTVCTHHILFLRHIYPPATFVSTRAYNYPVRQSRHPAVCTWINDAVAAISDQLFKSTVSSVSLCIFETDNNAVLERWMFNLLSFPVVAKRDRDVPFATNGAEGDVDLASKINLVDLEATFRATLTRITTAANKLKPLPKPPEGPECSFTLTIEVSSNADRPVGRIEAEERKWIVAEPDAEELTLDSPTVSTPAQPASGNTNPQSREQGKTHPIRRLSTHPLHIEMFVTESAQKFKYPTPNERTPAARAKAMSYGAGTRKFDAGGQITYDADGDGNEYKFNVEEGYTDIEGNDVNRKPAAGRGMEY
jgi:mitotic spindle assembly checkpoint protein MAD2B